MPAPASSGPRAPTRPPEKAAEGRPALVAAVAPTADVADPVHDPRIAALASHTRYQILAPLAFAAASGVLGLQVGRWQLARRAEGTPAGRPRA